MSPRSEPIPIAFCITDLDAGGAERALVQLVTRLDRAEWEPHVFCLSGEGELAQPLRDAGVPVTCLGARRSWNVGTLIRLRRDLRRIRPAILQTFLYHANIAGRIAGRIAGVPTIVSGIRVAERRSRFRLWLDRATERWVERHVCVSQGVATFSTSTGGLSADKIVVIPNGVDSSEFANAEPADLSEFGIAPTQPTVLFVGRLDPQKGIAVLLETFSQLAEQYSELQLLLVGDGPLRAEVERFADERRLQDHVHLTGRRNDVANLMQSTDCLVLPSLWEGMPNVILEAMAAGLPVIATAVEGTAELLVDGTTGRVVPPDDVRALRHAIAAQLDEPQIGLQWASQARIQVQNEYGWERTVAKYAELYHRLLDSN